MNKGEVSVAKAVGAMHMDTRRGAASKLEHAHPSLGKIVVITLGVSDPHSVNRATQSQVQAAEVVRAGIIIPLYAVTRTAGSATAKHQPTVHEVLLRHSKHQPTVHEVSLPQQTPTPTHSVRTSLLDIE